MFPNFSLKHATLRFHGDGRYTVSNSDCACQCVFGDSNLLFGEKKTAADPSVLLVPEVWAVTRMDTNSGYFTTYAFSSLESLVLFEELLTLTGVGPGKAVLCMQRASPTVLRVAVLDPSPSNMLALPGLPPKARQELVAKGAVEAPPAAPEIIPNSDAVAALMALGEKATEARAAVLRAMKAEPGASVSALIRMALKRG